MNGMKGMKIDITRYSCAAPNAGDHDDVFFIESQGIHSPYKAIQDNAVAAAGTPDMREKTFSDVIFSSHGSDSFPLDNAERIADVGRCDEHTVDTIGKEHFSGVFHG